MAGPATVDAHIEEAPLPVQPILRDLRQLIRATLPSLTERISYGMPAYDLRGQRFVHFAAAPRGSGGAGGAARRRPRRAGPGRGTRRPWPGTAGVRDCGELGPGQAGQRRRTMTQSFAQPEAL